MLLPVILALTECDNKVGRSPTSKSRLKFVSSPNDAIIYLDV